MDAETLKTRKERAEALANDTTGQNKAYHRGWYDALDWVINEHRNV